MRNGAGDGSTKKGQAEPRWVESTWRVVEPRWVEFTISLRHDGLLCRREAYYLNFIARFDSALCARVHGWCDIICAYYVLLTTRGTGLNAYYLLLTTYVTDLLDSTGDDSTSARDRLNLLNW